MKNEKKKFIYDVTCPTQLDTAYYKEIQKWNVMKNHPSQAASENHSQQKIYTNII